MGVASLHVEVAYALPNIQVLLHVIAPLDATVEEVIHQSGLLSRFPEIDLTRNKVGIFSKLVELHERVRDKDRVEVYRPLIADPKEVRRQRAAAGKSMKKEK